MQDSLCSNPNQAEQQHFGIPNSDPGTAYTCDAQMEKERILNLGQVEEEKPLGRDGEGKGWHTGELWYSVSWNKVGSWGTDRRDPKTAARRGHCLGSGSTNSKHQLCPAGTCICLTNTSICNQQTQKALSATSYGVPPQDAPRESHVHTAGTSHC